MDNRLYSPFIKSVKDIVFQMSGIELESEGLFYPEPDEIVSLGVSSIIAFAGKIKGRILLDMDCDLALTIAQKVNGTAFDSIKDNLVLATISEINNIISGDGLTALNNSYNLGLRLAPPIVFAGKNTVICIPKISPNSVDFINAKYGKLKLNIAFEGGIK